MCVSFFFWFKFVFVRMAFVQFRLLFFPKTNDPTPSTASAYPPCPTQSTALTSYQTKEHHVSQIVFPSTTAFTHHVLSAGVPLPWLWLVRPSLPVGTELPHNGDDAEHGGSGNERIGAPVGRLGVPTTRRRPDVLGVAILCRD